MNEQTLSHVEEIENPDRTCSEVSMRHAQGSADNLEGVSNALSIVIAATFTAEPVLQPLRFWMDKVSISANFAVAPYAQVMQELLDPASLFARNKSGFNVLLMRVEDWIRDRLHEERAAQNIEHIHKVADEFATAFVNLRDRTSASMLIVFCPSSSSLPTFYSQVLEEVQHELTNRLQTFAHVHCWTHADVASLFPMASHEDARSERIAHIPYTKEYFAAIATVLARRMTVLSKPQYKVIAVDCDNTLWKGICGEDGAAGVQLTPAHLSLQRLLVRQHDAGMLLCLCTKNNPGDVESVFRSRPEMLLREEHLICLRVNWSSKSSNLQSLARELDLSLESFIFIDDSSMECAEVRENCPAVLTLQMPGEAEEISHFIDHVWAFDRVEVTEEAKGRTKQYNENRARSKELQEAGGLEKFIASLELKVAVTQMQSGQLARVAELTQRTNQFNLTGRRRRADEIEALCRAGELQSLVVHVKDRFGDYGLVGAILIRPEGQSWDVDTFVLSCRVLGRRVEYRIVNELAEIARRQKVQRVLWRYRPTARNAPAREFVEKALSEFEHPSGADDDSSSERIFNVPVKAAQVLDSKLGVSELWSSERLAAPERPMSGGVVSTQWHESAYRLSRLPVLMEELRGFARKVQSAPSEYVGPCTPTEAALAKIWAEILGLDMVSVRADFFELGGDSLLAVRVIAAIGSVLGLELSVYDFFESSTIEKVAKRLADASESDAPIQITSRDQAVPLSSAQQRLWFINQLEGGSVAYHLPLAVRLLGKLDRVALRRALDQLINRHESLRTVFVNLEDGPVQRIIHEVRFALEFVDLRAQQLEERECDVLRLSREEVALPFDLAVGPLIRGRLLQLSEQEHDLLITMHHIVSDGWSIGVLIRELGALYEAYREGSSDPLPPLPIQYADYAQWQRQWLSSDDQRVQLEYWKRHLQGAPELSQLPTDRGRPSVESYRGADVQISLGSELTSDLKALARQGDQSLAMVLCAAWSAVLSRLSGQRDLILGMPIANRRRSEVEGLVGLFVNTLALRINLEDGLSMSELLQRVKQTMLEAFAHQDVPFEQVVEALRPTRSLSHSPVFQLLFVMQNAPRVPFELAGLVLQEREVLSHTAKFDLTLSLRGSDSGIYGTLNYATDLFDRSTIERWAEYFKTALRLWLKEPNLQLSSLPLSSEDERKLVIDQFNATHTVYLQETLLHQLFEEQVARTPDLEAVVFESEALTYSELNRKANQLASYLRGRGVGPDRRVAMCVERGLGMVVGLLAILKAGGAYVPLDPAHPDERLAIMLQDSESTVVLAQPNLCGRLAVPDNCILIELDMSRWGHSAWAGECLQNLDSDQVGLTASHLAYVIYTSGSTGKPKGVMVEHRNLLNFVRGLEQCIHRMQPDCRRIAWNSSFGFDMAAKAWGQLLMGRTVYLLSESARLDAKQLLSFLEQYCIEAIECTPSHLRMMQDAGFMHGRARTLRKVLLGGEPIEIEDWSALAASQETTFFNMYGPTECSVDATCGPIGGRVPNVGRVMPNARIYVLDDYMHPVPVGVTGEIYIAGAGLARGYWNRPGLTAERFMADPFGADLGARMYKTGDLGRWRPEGAIEYLGRNDHQVKIRGYRIELGEIEAQLRSDVRLKEVAVVARENERGEKLLTAYVTVRDKHPLSIDELRQHLRLKLPEYMVPVAFIVLDSFPLTLNGKLDRKALPIPVIGESPSEQYEAPQGDLENAMATIFQSMLRIKTVGRSDNFFELGGHSLLVLNLLFRINETIGSDLKVKDVYNNPSVRQLAACLSDEAAEDHLVDLEKESALDPDIVSNPSSQRGAVPAVVLLTGATGFVGRFLLAQLLQHSNTEVYCLVRASSPRHGFARLRTTLSTWGLWRDEFDSRVIAISADLQKPLLGLDKSTWEMLVSRVGSIYHCATSMDHLESYSMAKAENVVSAKEIVRLAAGGNSKLINYVSTLSIFSSSPIGTLKTVDEASVIDREKHRYSSGYAASKWVGEKIFMRARERGIPCNIFRLGLVWADAQQGRYDERQREYRLLKSSLLSGFGIENYMYPEMPIPVDYVARSLVSLANRHPCGNRTFHISSSDKMSKGLFEICNEVAGVSLRLVPHYQWICHIKRLHQCGRSLSIVPLVEFAFSMDEATFNERQRRVLSERVRVDCNKTQQELELVGLTVPPLSNALIRACLDSMLSRDSELSYPMKLGRLHECVVSNQ